MRRLERRKRLKMSSNQRVGAGERPSLFPVSTRFIFALAPSYRAFAVVYGIKRCGDLDQADEARLKRR